MYILSERVYIAIIASQGPKIMQIPDWTGLVCVPHIGGNVRDLWANHGNDHPTKITC